MVLILAVAGGAAAYYYGLGIGAAFAIAFLGFVVLAGIARRIHLAKVCGEMKRLIELGEFESARLIELPFPDGRLSPGRELPPADLAVRVLR